MMRVLGPLLAVLLLGGCALFGSSAETDQQKFYAVKKDYEALLTLLVSYRNNCEAKPAELRLGCDVYVEEAQKLMESDVIPAYETAKNALASGSSVELAAANAGLQAAVSRLTQYVLQHQIDTKQETGLSFAPAFA